MAYKCYKKTSSNAFDFMSQFFAYIEEMGWVKEKGMELADATTFQTAHAYAQGNLVKPTTLNEHVYICSTAGTSAATEPTWGTATKGETTSGSAKFRCYFYSRVYSSQGESGVEPKNYIYLDYTGSGPEGRVIGIIGLAQWIASTWLCGPYNADYQFTVIGLIANPCYFWIYGNKDFVVVNTVVGATYNYSGFGFFVPVWTQRTVLTSAASAGSAVNLEVASSANVKVGQWLQMWGATEEGRDKVVVSAVPDGTHITVTTLARNYSSGSWIGVMPGRAITMGPVAGAIGGASYYMRPIAIGTDDAGPNNAFSPVQQLQEGISPEARLNKYLLRPVFYISSYHEGSYWNYGLGGYLPTDVILQQYKTCAPLDLFLIYDGYSYPVSGTATAGAATTLTDTGKSLTTNAWAGYILVISGGIGVGQTRAIISNTATEFTVNAWDTPPDASSTYIVVQEAWRALGNGAANGAVCKEIL